jgi:hypothetical protein
VTTYANKTSKKAEIKDNYLNDLKHSEEWIYLRNTNMQRNSCIAILLKGKKE